MHRRFKNCVDRMGWPLPWLGAVLLCASPSWAQAPDLSQVDGTAALRDVTARWVETRGLIDKEKSDWKLAESLLEDRIALVQAEIDAVEERTAEARSSKSEADLTYEQLLARSKKASAASEALSTFAEHAAERVRTLLDALPEPLERTVQSLADRVRREEDFQKQSLSNRYLSLVGILNAAEKFNGSVETASEIRRVSDGSLVQATVLYLGLTAGYYVTGDGAHAGTGVPGPDGWVWTPGDGIAASVSTCIEIFENRAAPAFVRLPVGAH